MTWPLSVQSLNHVPHADEVVLTIGSFTSSSSATSAGNLGMWCAASAGAARSGVALEERRSEEKLPLTIAQTRRAPRMPKILESLLARISGKQGGVVGAD
jgi:hypothetical protein